MGNLGEVAGDGEPAQGTVSGACVLRYADLPVRAGAVRTGLAKAAWLTAIINVLSLTCSFAILSLYDLALPAKSPSGLACSVVAMGGVAALCFWLEIRRGRVLSGTGAALERNLRWRLLEAAQSGAGKLRGPSNAGQLVRGIVRDMEQVRVCVSGPSGAAVLDLPAVPIFLLAVYGQHLLLGLFATCGVLLAISIAYVSHLRTTRAHTAAARALLRRLKLCDALGSAVGARRDVTARWHDLSEVHTRLLEGATAGSATAVAAIKAARAAMQTGVVVSGAWLVMHDELTPGAIVVTSILVTRAIAPVEAAAANWRRIARAAASWRRLTLLIDAVGMDVAQPEFFRHADGRIEFTRHWTGPSRPERMRARRLYERPMLE